MQERHTVADVLLEPARFSLSDVLVGTGWGFDVAPAETALASREARRLADACASVLTQQTQSAEVFAQLIQRAHLRKDFARVDAAVGAARRAFAPRKP